MSGIGRPRGRPRGSKGNGKAPSVTSSSEQRNIANCTTQPVSTPSPSCSNPTVPLGTFNVLPPATERTSPPQDPQPTTDIEHEIVTPTEEANDDNNQSEPFIPFGDPTLPGPHNTHLPWGKDLSDKKVWIYVLKGL